MVVFNEARPKYVQLDQIFECLLSNISFSNQVNIIVDMKDIVTKFFRPDMSPQITDAASLIQEISADLLNTIAHYRNYFYKQGKYTTFYIVYSYEKSGYLKEKYPTFREYYYQHRFDEEPEKAEIIKKSVKAVETIIKQIPHAYFFNSSDYGEIVFVRSIIEKLNADDATIILTNDDLMHQFINKHVFVLTIKGPASSLRTSENAISEISGHETELPASCIPAILSIAGDKYYSLANIPGIAFPRAAKIVENLVEKSVCSKDITVENPIKFADLDPTNKMDAKVLQHKDQISSNFSMLTGYEVYYGNKILIDNLVNTIIATPKKSSTKLLGELNAKIYTMFPINLDMLIRGEQL